MHFSLLEPTDFSPEAIALLKQTGLSPTDNTSKVDILYIRLAHKIDQSLLSKYSRLKYLVTPTTGLDHIDTRECHRLGINIISLRDIMSQIDSITSTSELALLLILASLRNLRRIILSESTINVADRLKYRGRDLASMNYGIFGIGRLGSQLYYSLTSLGADPVVWDSNSARMEIAPPDRRCSSLDDLLMRCNCLSIHVDLNDSSRGILNTSNLVLMPKGSIIVNTSRAEIIDRLSLEKLIRNYHIHTYATDVVWDETSQTPDPLLSTLQKEGYNILVTPHVGGCTLDSMHATEVLITNHLITRIYNL